MRYYSNSITKPFENKLTKLGLTIVSANNVGKQTICLGVPIGSDLSQIDAAITKRWRYSVDQKESHIEIKFNKIY